jgi:hypothetical protein
MITVDGPDGSTFEFPDDMAHGDIESALSKHYGVAPVSTGEDIKKSILPALQRGAAGLVGMPGDASTLLNKGLDKLNDYLGPKLGYTPEQIAKVQVGDNGSPIFPTSEEVRGAADKVTGIGDYRPQTLGGKIAGGITEMVPGALTGGARTAGGLAADLGRYAVAPALASEAAGKFAEGTPYEGAARFVGSLAGSGVASKAITPFASHAEEATRAAHERAVDVLKGAGVPVTAGQRADSQGLKYAENALSPDQSKMLEGFTRAATRAGGAETPVLQHGAGGTIDTLRNEVGGRFDALASGNTMHADPKMGMDLSRLHSQYTSVPGAYDDATVKALNGYAQHVTDLMRDNGGAMLTGEQYQRLRSHINTAAMGAEGDKSRALHDLVDVLDTGMERSIARTNPADAGEFGRAREDYKKALVLEKAATAAGESSARGYITPAQLERAAKGVYGARAYERGQTPFSQLGNAGAAVLKALPDSGTAHRAWANHAIGALSGAAGGALGFQFGGGAKEAGEAAIAGLLLGEKFEHILEPGTRAAARALALNPVAQRYLGNQMLAGRQGARSVPGLLSAAIAAGRQP